MADMTDPRAMRSRAALLAVAADMLDHPTDGELSMTDVAARAGVSRPTFYQHFSDVHALLAAAVTEELAQAFAHSDASLTGASMVDFLRGTSRMLVEQVHSRRDAYAHVLRGPASYEVLSATVGYVSMRMRENALGARLNEHRGDVNEDRVTATAAGVVWMVTRWLDSDFTGPNEPETFAARLADLMLGQIGTPGSSP